MENITVDFDPLDLEIDNHEEMEFEGILVEHGISESIVEAVE